MELNESEDILNQLQYVDSEASEIYYTVLENEEDSSVTEVADENVFYFSLKEDDTNVQEDSTPLKTEQNLDISLVEKVILPDGTQAYVTKATIEGDEDLTHENIYSNIVCLEQFGENSQTEIMTLESSEDEKDERTDETLTEEIDEKQYRQIQLDNGKIAMIDIELYESLMAQNKKKTRTSTGVKSFFCPMKDCNKAYTTQHHLRVHLRIHTGSRPYKCEVHDCKKAFSTGYSLKAHSRTHTGEKPYCCNVCTKSFKTSGDLLKHHRTHTGERPFVCPIEGCDRSFTTSNIRKVHVRSHTGERPYKCTVENCEKAFASATNFKNHMRIHSGEKPYQCSVEGCGKRFTEYSSLYKHHLVHDDTKEFKCNYCGKCFRQTSSLVSHKRAIHNIIVTQTGAELLIHVSKPKPHIQILQYN